MPTRQHPARPSPRQSTRAYSWPVDNAAPARTGAHIPVASDGSSGNVGWIPVTSDVNPAHHHRRRKLILESIRSLPRSSSRDGVLAARASLRSAVATFGPRAALVRAHVQASVAVTCHAAPHSSGTQGEDRGMSSTRGSACQRSPSGGISGNVAAAPSYARSLAASTGIRCGAPSGSAASSDSARSRWRPGRLGQTRQRRIDDPCHGRSASRCARIRSGGRDELVAVFRERIRSTSVSASGWRVSSTSFERGTPGGTDRSVRRERPTRPASRPVRHGS